MSDFDLDITGFRGMGVNLANFSGLWSVEPIHFRQHLGMITAGLAEHVKANVAADAKVVDVRGDGFSRGGEKGSVAVIRLAGTLTKQGDSFGGGSMVLARRAVREASRDDSISGILLIIDSPGGTVAGTQDLADEVYSAGQKKPVYTLIEDLGASAAYWIGAQGQKVFAANQTTLVGSIGTYLAVYDSSKAAEQEGVRVVLVKAGEFKGGGVPGTAISDEQVAEWQKMVDRLQAQFSAGVQRGRGMDKSQVDELTTGLVYTASEAKKLGLIDGIQSLETTLQQLQKAGRKAQTPRSVSMSETVQPVAATYKEIVAACSGIDAANAEDAMFITDAMRRELTASQASSDWCKTLKARADAAREELDAKSKELENARSEAAKPSPAKGVPTVGTRNGKDTESSHADALSEWNEEVDRHVKAGISRSEAVKKAAKRRPDLQKAVVGMANGNYQAN